MRKFVVGIIVVSFMFLAAAGLNAAPAQNNAAGKWFTNLEKAQSAAKAAKKPILLVISGSDWCPPCKMLERNILSQNAFRTDAAKRVILLHADFPRERKQSAEEKSDARKIAAKYQAEGVPTVYLLSPEGVVLDKKVGYINVKPEKYLDLFKGMGK